MVGSPLPAPQALGALRFESTVVEVSSRHVLLQARALEQGFSELVQEYRFTLPHGSSWDSLVEAGAPTDTGALQRLRIDLSDNA